MKKLIFLSIILMLAQGFSSYAQSVTVLDSTFGTNGIVVTDFGGDESLTNIFLQNDGKILGVGEAGNEIMVVRYLSNGTIDSAFGNNGRAITDFGGSYSWGNAIAMNSKNIIAVGRSDSNLIVVAYTPEGIIDSNFANNGIFSLAFSLAFQTDMPWILGLRDVRIQADDKIVVCGNDKIIRLTDDGMLDSSFADNGIATLSNSYSGLLSLQIKDDGKIVAAGHYNFCKFHVVQLLQDGSPDSSFGNDGVVTTQVAGGFGLGLISSILLLPDNELVCVGIGGYDWGANRITFANYLPDGALNPNLNGGNYLMTNDYFPQVFLSSNGFIQEDSAYMVLTSSNSLFHSDSFAMKKFNADYTVDTTFGSGGTLKTNMNSTFACANSILKQNDNKIVLAGSSGDFSHRDIALARYKNIVVEGTTLNIANENEAALAIAVYPNPATTVLNIRADAKLLIKQINIADLQGRVLRSYGKRDALDIAFLSPGAYTIEIQTSKGKWSEKFEKR